MAKLGEKTGVNTYKITDNDGLLLGTIYFVGDEPVFNAQNNEVSYEYLAVHLREIAVMVDNLRIARQQINESQAAAV